VRKFDANVRGILSAEAAGQLRDRVMRLDRLADTSELTAQLIGVQGHDG
jgi:hypothetical protein